MATLTSNASAAASLSISGTTQKSTTISWSLPTVPAGATITSCTLTGTATASMSKGGATIKVNGTTVSSGSNFTINLGTGNTTSSVTATAKGGNKNASGTVTFSNLVYTVNYSIPLPKYTVTFVDYDDRVLKTQEVEEGSSATAPSSPTRTGYTFTGWDKTFTNITSNLTVTAQYEIAKYTVTFVDWDGTVLKTQEVEHGSAATAPANPSRTGYSFDGWDVAFTNVTSNLTVTAQYSEGDTLKFKENGAWTNIGKVYKKISGAWVEKLDDTLDNLFDVNIKYICNVIAPTAILYSDGTFIFQNTGTIDSSHGDIIETYIDWDIIDYNVATQCLWLDKKENIINIVLNTFVRPISLYGWFYKLSNLESISVRSFDTSNVTNMAMTFRGCSSLTSLDLSSFNTSNVTNMGQLFMTCSSLTSLDLSNFDTSKVTDMDYMFSGCSSLTSLDLSNFDTSNVTTMYYMFSGCSSLTSLDLSNFDTSNVTTMAYMFNGCTNLQTIYVKDETVKTQIETSYNFPSTATVIIGSPA